MNLYKVTYEYTQKSFMIIEADDLDEAQERFEFNASSAVNPKILSVTRLDEVPETAPMPRNELN